MITRVTAIVESFGVQRPIEFTIVGTANLLTILDRIARYGARVSHKITWEK